MLPPRQPRVFARLGSLAINRAILAKYINRATCILANLQRRPLIVLQEKHLQYGYKIPLQNFDRDLGENLGEFLAGEIAEISVRSRRDLGEISKSRRDSRRDLGEILKSRRPKTCRDSRRDLKISSRFSTRSW